MHCCVVLPHMFQLKHSFLKGIKDFSVPIGLDDKVQVDLVIVGSVAVSEKGKTLHLRMI